MLRGIGKVWWKAQVGEGKGFKDEEGEAKLSREEGMKADRKRGRSKVGNLELFAGLSEGKQ